ncbi:MAG TPA: MBL fold metallo-hydrolase [bacterium]|jgi:glyoxylase-like metal-dependent hydrolase (beta-lactamase superfamily II)
MILGPYAVSLIESGDFKLDGGAMFGVVPKPLWSRACPADDLNRIDMTMHCLLIETADRKILVDTGCGDKDSLRFREIYGIDTHERSLLTSLKVRGVKPQEITDVIYTHLHFDHAGGSTRVVEGITVPVFPKAQHYVQKRHWEHALKPTERDRASFIPANYVPVHESGLLNLIDGDTEIFPGIKLIMVDGHTPAMQMVTIQSDDKTIWFAADLIPMSAHVPLPYIMGYDLFPLTTLEEKKKYLKQAADERWIAVFEHDPAVPASHLVLHEQGYVTRGENVVI